MDSIFIQNNDSIRNFSSAIINAISCTITDYIHTYLGSENNALIQISNSSIKQSNDPVPWVKIGKNCKLELKNICIEGGKKIFLKTELTEAKKIDLEELYFNNAKQNIFHFENK
jgi:hypothetical protein